MQYLPKVSPRTRIMIEGRCTGEKNTSEFVKDVWGELIRENRKISNYLFILFDILERPIWRGTATIAICQLYRALDIEMTRVPEVGRLAFQLVQNRLAKPDREKYWQRKAVEFRFENPELSKLVDYSSLEWLEVDDNLSAQRVSQVALTVYLLIESQIQISKTPFLAISG